MERPIPLIDRAPRRSPSHSPPRALARTDVHTPYVHHSSALQARNASAMFERQRSMEAWVARSRSKIRNQLLSTSRTMRNRLWRPPTSCDLRPLRPQQVARQHAQLASYWRRPQPREPSLLRGEATSIFGSNVPTPFLGSGGLCHASSVAQLDEAAESATTFSAIVEAEARSLSNWKEACKSTGCAPPLIGAFDCGPRESGVCR